MINKIYNSLNNYFHLSKHNTSVKTELLAAITNYFTLLYVITLVPEIIIGAFPNAVDEKGEIIGAAIVTGNITAAEMLIAITFMCFIAAGIGSIFMGLIVNVPFIQGPSLTISTFIVYVVCSGFGYTYNQALAIVFISGICFFIMAYTGIEHKLHKAIPTNIKYAVSAGVGMFIAYTGLIKAHIIQHSASAINIFDLTDLSSKDTLSAYLALAGVILITIMLKKHVHGAIFIGKIICTVLAIPLGLITAVSFSSLSFNFNIDKIIFQLDFYGLIDISSPQKAFFSFSTLLAIIFSICIMDIFETITMIIASKEFVKISKENRHVDERIPKILEVDAAGTSIGALLGTTSVSTYIESTTGVIEGGRTGLTAVITGILFIISSIAAPLVSIVPSAATATTLIMAGILMMAVIKYIDFRDEAEAVPAFFTMFLMPLTNSLIIGISVGIIIYLLIHIFTGNTHKVHPTLYTLAILFGIVLILLPK